MRRRKRRALSPISFEAFGVPVEVEVGDPDLETAVRAILPPGWKECKPTESARRFALQATGDAVYELTGNYASWLDDATLDVALLMLDAEIRLHIAANAVDLVFVHAGVVARDGAALVLAGGSFSGKTTLVRALVEGGATYYSDEYAVFDEDGLVQPYPRPLSVRRGGALERQAPNGRVVAGDERATLAAVVLTHYRPGVEWQPQRLSSGKGLVALLSNAVPGKQTPEQSLRALRRAVTGATTLSGDRGEAGPVASALLAELDAGSGSTGVFDR